MSLFTPLTYEEKYVHLQYPSGILASGEANFADTSQVEIVNTFDTVNSPLNRNGLNFTENSYLSNASLSRDLSINDFQIFNSYVHYVPNPNGGDGQLETVPYAFKINTSEFYNKAVSRFNIYNTKYRPLS